MRISFGAIILVLWFSCVNGWELSAKILFAACIHELGHFIALRLCGAEIYKINVGVLGADMESDTHRLSYGQELIAVLAGPMTNLALVLLGTILQKDPVFVGINAVMFLFNMMPISPLDGGRMTRIFMMLWLGPDRGERFSGYLGGGCAFALFCGLIWLVYRSGGSLWLLPSACWMLWVSVKEFLGK